MLLVYIPERQSHLLPSKKFPVQASRFLLLGFHGGYYIYTTLHLVYLKFLVCIKCTFNAIKTTHTLTGETNGFP